MKNIINYLFKYIVDFTILLIIIAFIIKYFLYGLYVDTIVGILFFFCIYVFGVILRLGSALNDMNERILDNESREKLHLYPYVIKDRTWYVNTLTYIWIGVVTIFLVLFITL